MLFVCSDNKQRTRGPILYLLPAYGHFLERHMETTTPFFLRWFLLKFHFCIKTSTSFQEVFKKPI